MFFSQFLVSVVNSYFFLLFLGFDAILEFSTGQHASMIFEYFCIRFEAAVRALRLGYIGTLSMGNKAKMGIIFCLQYTSGVNH